MFVADLMVCDNVLQMLTSRRLVLSVQERSRTCKVVGRCIKKNRFASNKTLCIIYILLLVIRIGLSFGLQGLQIIYCGPK